MNQPEKAILAGKLYDKVAARGTDFDDYFRLAQAIQNCYYEDLKYLLKFKDDKEFPNSGDEISKLAANNLYHLGLLRTSHDFDGGGASIPEEAFEWEGYFINEYGKLIRDIL